MNNIKKYRLKLGLTQLDLCGALGISQAALSGWESGRFEPDISGLRKLSNILGVSIDDILCHSAPHNLEETQAQAEPFPKLLKLLRNEHHMSQDDLASTLCVSKSTISMYENGERTPPSKVLERIADTFDVSIDCLIGRDKLVSKCYWSQLQSLRIKAGLKQEDLANALDVSRSTIAMWETSKSRPDHVFTAKIADYFGVTIDYLLGRSSTENVSHTFVTRLPERLKLLRKKHHVTQEDLANQIGVERSSIGKYETGTIPSIEVLSFIADFFNVSVDYLIGRDTNTNQNTIKLLDHNGIYIEKKLTDEQIKILQIMIQALPDSQ